MAVRSLKNSTLENFANYSSSMNAGYSFQDFELIESVFVASPAASVSFNNLDQYATEYKHLQIRFNARITTATNQGNALLRFNSDNGANYNWHQLFGDGSSVTSLAYTNSDSIDIAVVAGANQGSGVFSSAIIDVLDSYSNAKNKTLRALVGHRMSTGANYVLLRSAAWRSTSPINICSILASSDGFAVGSRFSLYGIR